MPAIIMNKFNKEKVNRQQNTTVKRQQNTTVVPVILLVTCMIV